MFFLSENAAMPPGQQVKVHVSASFVDILEVCKFTTFCDRKGYTAAREHERAVSERTVIHCHIPELQPGGGGDNFCCRCGTLVFLSISKTLLLVHLHNCISAAAPTH